MSYTDVLTVSFHNYFRGWTLDIWAKTRRGSIHTCWLSTSGSKSQGKETKLWLLLNIFLLKILKSIHMNDLWLIICTCFRQSCTKVAVDFVSPENIGECLRLTEEFRKLPKFHRVREDKLEVTKYHLIITFRFVFVSFFSEQPN